MSPSKASLPKSVMMGSKVVSTWRSSFFVPTLATGGGERYRLKLYLFVNLKFIVKIKTCYSTTTDHNNFAKEQILSKK